MPSRLGLVPFFSFSGSGPTPAIRTPPPFPVKVSPQWLTCRLDFRARPCAKTKSESAIPRRFFSSCAHSLRRHAFGPNRFQPPLGVRKVRPAQEVSSYMVSALSNIYVPTCPAPLTAMQAKYDVPGCTGFMRPCPRQRPPNVNRLPPNFDGVSGSARRWCPIFPIEAQTPILSLVPTPRTARAVELSISMGGVAPLSFSFGHQGPLRGEHMF